MQPGVPIEIQKNVIQEETKMEKQCLAVTETKDMEKVDFNVEKTMHIVPRIIANEINNESPALIQFNSIYVFASLINLHAKKERKKKRKYINRGTITQNDIYQYILTLESNHAQFISWLFEVGKTRFKTIWTKAASLVISDVSSFDSINTNFC